jgi:hypothetical protein
MWDDSILDPVLAAKLHTAIEHLRAQRKKRLASAFKRLVEEHKAMLEAKAATAAMAAAAAAADSAASTVTSGQSSTHTSFIDQLNRGRQSASRKWGQSSNSDESSTAACGGGGGCDGRPSAGSGGGGCGEEGGPALQQWTLQAFRPDVFNAIVNAQLPFKPYTKRLELEPAGKRGKKGAMELGSISYLMNPLFCTACVPHLNLAELLVDEMFKEAVNAFRKILSRPPQIIQASDVGHSPH